MDPDNRHDARERCELRCRRLLDRSSPLAVSDLDWDSAPDTALDPSVLAVLVYMRDVEGFTDRDLVGFTAHRSTLRDPLLAEFLEVWRFEESVHAAMLERFLDAYGRRHEVDVPPRQLPPPAVVSPVERLVAGVGPVVGPVVTAAHMAWGAGNELLTMNGYRLLSARCRHPLLAALLRRIAVQESRHFSFYVLQAEWRLRASGLARAVLPWVLRRTWTPVGVGDGYKSASEFAAVYSYLSSGDDGRRAVARMDHRFASLPGFGGLAVFQRVADTASD